MVLYLIGLGLGDYTDITVKGLDVVKKADKVYLEYYTSKLVGSSIEELEKYYGKKIHLAERKDIEQEQNMPEPSMMPEDMMAMQGQMQPEEQQLMQ